VPADEVDAIKIAVAQFQSKDGLNLPSMAIGISAA
jgi:hypothetical protein